MHTMKILRLHTVQERRKMATTGILLLKEERFKDNCNLLFDKFLFCLCKRVLITDSTCYFIRLFPQWRRTMWQRTLPNASEWFVAIKVDANPQKRDRKLRAKCPFPGPLHKLPGFYWMEAALRRISRMCQEPDSHVLAIADVAIT